MLSLNKGDFLIQFNKNGQIIFFVFPNLLKRDTSPDYIAEIFDLSIDEVMEIKANLDG